LIAIPILRDWRIDDPLRAELVEEPRGGPEDASGLADVLAEEDDVAVPPHLGS
jgi:hypothetical protein